MNATDRDSANVRHATRPTWQAGARRTGLSERAGLSKRHALMREPYLLRGQIEVMPCCVCGHADAEMHHPDHSRPLYVFWLCRPHHLEWHRVERGEVPPTFENWLPEGAAARPG